MSTDKVAAFRAGIEKLEELSKNDPSSPPPLPPSDTGMPENERGHTNFIKPQNTR